MKLWSNFNQTWYKAFLGEGDRRLKTWISFTQGCFVLSLVKIGPVVLEKKMKMWKVYDNNNNNDDDNDRQRTEDKFWLEKLTWAFGSGELKMGWHQKEYKEKGRWSETGPHCHWRGVKWRRSSHTDGENGGFPARW